jgi:hypothetical protein
MEVTLWLGLIANLDVHNLLARPPRLIPRNTYDPWIFPLGALPLVLSVGHLSHHRFLYLSIVFG